jgi:DGQHR domain-containing protein
MAKIRYVTSSALESKFGTLKVFHTTMAVKDVLSLSYVAVRGRDKEDGAVQRFLNKKRVEEITKFILLGNTFYNTFIINWTNQDLVPKFAHKEITIPITPYSAQIIDGQHRLAGLEEAIRVNKKIGEQKILITVCLGLSTQEAARIFVNINSEQRPVPKSLIYDLFGEVEDNENHETNRAVDIATELNENSDSPYFGLIKFPGKLKGPTGVDLSSVVSALKKSLEPSGVFPSHNLTNLQNQKMVVLNYFTAIKSFYDKEELWENKAKNPFLTSAGFIGAVEYLTTRLLTKCAEKKSFEVDTFKVLLNFPKGNLLDRADLKSLEGKSQRKVVSDFLESSLLKDLPGQDEYKFY